MISAMKGLTASLLFTLLAANAALAGSSGEQSEPNPKPADEAVALAPSQPFELTTQSGNVILPHGKCHYFLDRARATGDATLMQRYEACENG